MILTFWYTLVLGFVAAYISDYFRNLFKYIRLAQRINLPYTVASHTGSSLAIIYLCGTSWFCYIVDNWLPGTVADNLNDTVLKARWKVKNRLVKRYGGVYIRVSPKNIVCTVSDASVACQVFNARQTFPKPAHQYEILNLYGPNLVSCEDKEWAHHRRHTATTFNEKNNLLVWKTTIQQSTEILEYWQETSLSKNEFVVMNIREDMLKFTLNILSHAGFGVRIPFKPVPQHLATNPDDIFRDSIPPPAGFEFTFRSVMAYINVNIARVIMARMVPQWISGTLSPLFKRDIFAHRDLEIYLRKLIDTGKPEFDEDSERAANLVDGMLLSRKNTQQNSKDPGLSDTELMGNMFIFSIAGHETTATTMRYALLLLALHQDVQGWLYEGIKEAIRDESSDIAEWDYERLFPKLVAPLCVMLETMRLFPPVVTIPKWNGDTTSSINYRGKDYILPPQTNININATGLHYSEEYWGNDAAEFHPQRWDANNKDSFLARNSDTPGLASPGLDYPTVHKPVRGAYIPFSDGVRACLGKKFAQVETVVALAVIFSQYHVGLVENTKQARVDAVRALEDSVSVLTLAMQKSIPLKFWRR